MHKLLLFLLLVSSTALAQSPNRISIRGVLVDSSDVILPAATVMLLTPKDSTLANYGRSNDKGAFEFKGVKKATYLLRVSYVGYLPLQQVITPGEEAVTDLGTIKLKPIAKELYEVVIKTAKAPLTIRGDTVEYNAASFKVPPGSTVEDLLRKLPGVQIDQDGNLKAQGEDIKRVTVDGKNFFGGDPKLATKNLPADALAKVQVFNSQSEQSKITGVEDGKKEKTMNLELKENARKGGFGKVTAGVGSQGRAELKGNYNRFNSKQQFSVLGFGNNTNQTGVSWDDFQDFRGSQSFNWNDDADFGFGGGARYFSFGDDGESLTIPVSGRPGRGFSNNAAGGANYNYDTKKTKLSVNYFFNQTEQRLDAISTRQSIIPNETYTTAEQSFRKTFNANHRVGLRFEKNIDSLNTLIFIVNGRFNGGDERYNSAQQFVRMRQTRRDSSTTDLNNATDFNALVMASTLIYRHKFRKKGRNFAASLGYNLNDTEGSGVQRSANEFFNTSGANNFININQDNNTISLRNEIKSSLFFLEPLSKKFFWESFYNLSLRTDKVDRDVFDLANEDRRRNDGLSRYYTNEFSFHRLGTSVRYAHKGINLSVGLAGQQFRLRGKFASDQTSSTFTNVDRTYFAWVPNAYLNYDLKNNRFLFSNYSVSVRQPSTRDLQPVIDNSNPRYIREGNPNLLPQLSHILEGGFRLFNPANFTNLYVNLNYAYNINQFVYNQTVDSLLITRTKPANISGGSNVGSYLGFGFPLKKTKSNLNVNASVNYGKNPSYINDILNQTRTSNYNIGLRLDLTPSEKFTLYANANFGVTNARYSINTTQNQQIFNHTYGADMNVQFPKNFYLNSNFNYRVYLNDRFGFDQRVPILNLSVYKHLLKDKKAELRLTAYDVFNQNLGVTQSASQNFVSEERVQTLARYFMLSFTYNMRGVKSQMRRQGFF